MKEIWNSTFVNPPPNLTYEIKGDRIDAPALSKICSNAVSVLDRQQTLHLEAAALSRILYRTKVKMRFDKGIMYMAKVNRCLLQYLSMDLAAAYNSLKSSGEDGFGVVCAPSRQRLEWVLLRTQGFAQLFCHIMKTCERAAYYMMCRMRLGHVWDLALISLALVSRVWTISKYLVLQSCEWYKLLKPYQDILQPVGLPWLSAGYEFPDDLISWLQVPHLTAPVELKSNKESRHREIFDLINLDDDDEDDDVAVEELFAEAIAQTADEIEPEKLNNNLTDCKELSETDYFPQTEDIGEPVTSVLFLPSGKRRKEAMKEMKNTEPGQDVKHTLFSKTALLPSNKKRKMVQHNEKEEDEISVNILKLTSKKKKKETEVEQEVQDEVWIETDMKRNEIEQNTEKNIFVKTIRNPSKKKKKKKDTELEWEIENEVQLKNSPHLKPPSVEQIKTFKSVYDLKEFLIKERKIRKKKSEDCATKGMDKLQWHMFEKAMQGYVQKLSSGDLIEGDSEYKRILKQAKKEILIRIQ